MTGSVEKTTVIDDKIKAHLLDPFAQRICRFFLPGKDQFDKMVVQKRFRKLTSEDAIGTRFSNSSSLDFSFLMQSLEDFDSVIFGRMLKEEFLYLPNNVLETATHFNYVQVLAGLVKKDSIGNTQVMKVG